MEEHEDHLTINDQVFTKPFVEKPLNADDHNIYIYYPQAAGGGSQRLFRKVSRYFLISLCLAELIAKSYILVYYYNSTLT